VRFLVRKVHARDIVTMVAIDDQTVVYVKYMKPRGLVSGDLGLLLKSF